MHKIDQDCRKRMVKARTMLLISHPFYGSLAMYLKLVQIDNPALVDTMAVDGVHLFYHPPFVKKLTDDEVVGVWAHEVEHCCRQHMTRRGHREPDVWNEANDYIINADLHEAKITLPVPHLFDPQYKGMSSEELYERLIKQPRPKKKAAVAVVGLGLPGMPSQAACDPGACGGVIDAAPQGSPEQKAAVQAQWEGAVRMAVATARRAGTLPAHMDRMLKELERAKISWRDQTRSFIDQSMTKDWSWQRPNRRGHSLGIILPGYISDRLRQLIMVVDTSGSISVALMKAMVSEAAAALQEGSCDELVIIYADASVNHVDTFHAGDVIEAKDIKAVGGGGTDFRDTFNWIRDNAPEASCVIYLTDMITSSWGEDPGCPVLWGAYLPGDYYDRISKEAPFGDPLWISGAEG